MTQPHSGSALRGTLLRRLPEGVFGSDLTTTPQASAARGEELPHPYAIEPPVDGRSSYQPRETFSFGITLFGQANRLLPDMVQAVNNFDYHFGLTGADGRRGGLSLREVVAEQPLTSRQQVVWSADHRPASPFEGEARGLHFADVLNSVPAEAGEVRLLFRTPLTLKARGEVVRSGPPLEVLMQRLLERVGGLVEVLTEARLRLPFAELTAVARAATVAAATQWLDLERYSSTHERKHSIGGLVGLVTYRGELGPLLAWLTFGQWLHVGKAAVQGNGSYRVVAVD